MDTALHAVDLTGIGPVQVTVAEYGSGQPFLALHGGAGPQSVTGFAEKFAAACGVRLLVPTHPGFGGNAPPGALNSVGGLAALHSALLDQLGLIDPSSLPPAAQAITAGNRAAISVYAGAAMTDPALARRLGTLDIPALVLWGEREPALP